MKWPSGTAYLRRLIGAPAVATPRIERPDLTGTLWLLADAAICFAFLWSGATVGVSQIIGLGVGALVNYAVNVRPRAPAARPAQTWQLAGAWMVVAVLALFLRGGVIDALIQNWAWSPYAAVALAVLVTGVFTRLGSSASAAILNDHTISQTQWRTLTIGVAGYAFLLRLVYSAQVELLPEEAYYWNYSRHLDIGYLDHPPMVAWLIRAGTAWFADPEFGVRFAALCCGVVTSVFTFRLTRNIFGEPSASLALGLAQILPFFFLSGMLMTPDAPLTAAWAASLYFLERALVAGHARSWIWAGCCVGIGLLSKYTIGLLVLATLVFMLRDPPSRRWLRRREPYLAALIALIFFLPVIVWNAEHGWASFVFQTARRLAERPHFSTHKLVGSIFILMTPTAALALTAALWSRSSAACRASRFLEIAVILPLAVFLVFSLRHEVKLDWTGAPFTAALPLLAFGIVEARDKSLAGFERRLRAAWLPTLAGMLLIYGSGLYHLTLGIPSIGYSTHMELVPVAWHEFAGQIDSLAAGLRRRYGDQLLIVGMDRYAIASESAFYSSDQSRAVAQTSAGHFFDDAGLMYAQWFPAAAQAGRTFLLVAWDANTLSTARLEPRVATLSPIQEGVVTHDGVVVRRYYYRVAAGYRPNGAP